MEKLDYGQYQSGNTDIAFSSGNGYTNDPGSELETRKQLSYPLKEIKDFLGKAIPVNNSDKVVQLVVSSTDALQYRTEPNGALHNITGGIPTGGTTGQVLAKRTNTDLDVEWDTLPDFNNYATKTYVDDKVASVSLPTFTIKGTITPTVDGGSIESSDLKYALTADKTVGMFWGNAVVRGLGSGSPIVMTTGVQVSPAPATSSKIKGILSAGAGTTAENVDSLFLGVDLNGYVTLNYICSSNRTAILLTPTVIRFSDFE